MRSKTAENRGKNIGQLYRQKKEEVMLGLGMLIVFLISVWYLGENYSLKIWGDEFGYWQSAAYITGKDWSSVAATNSYYGFGYGILLAPIMLLFGRDSMLMMQAALVLEAVMLTSCVLAAYLCIGYFSDSIKGLAKVILAVLPILYPSNILYVNLTMAEILLVTLTWWYSYFVLRFIREKKFVFSVMLIAMSVYMYAVHQRTIAVMAISFALILWVYRKKILNSKLIILVGVFAVCLIAVMMFKKTYVRDLYTGANEVLYNNNNLSGQTSKIVNILTSWEGFSKFLASLVGKFYYISVASAMLVPLGVLNIVRTFLQYLKEKNDWDKLLGMLVIGLNFFAAYMIGVIYMSVGYHDRTDILIYGRYIEHTVGPLIVMGILYLYQDDRLKEVLVILSITALAAVYADKTIGFRAANSHVFANCSGIADLFKDSLYLSGEPLYLALIRSSIFLFALYLVMKAKDNLKDGMLNIVLLSLGVMWTVTAYKVRSEKVIPWADDLYRSQIEVLHYIDEPEFGLYHAHMGGFFQFLRVDSKVQHYETLENIADSDQSMYIITYTKAEDIDKIRDEQDILFENEMYVVWRSNVD